MKTTSGEEVATLTAGSRMYFRKEDQAVSIFLLHQMGHTTRSVNVVRCHGGNDDRINLAGLHDPLSLAWLLASLFDLHTHVVSDDADGITIEFTS